MTSLRCQIGTKETTMLVTTTTQIEALLEQRIRKGLRRAR
jgi:hypothetical protein